MGIVLPNVDGPESVCLLRAWFAGFVETRLPLLAKSGRAALRCDR